MTSPHEMAEEVVNLSGMYSDMSTRLAELLRNKAVKWAEFRVTTNSDKSADKAWDATADGLEEMGLRLQLKACEKRMSALKSMLRVLETEARNVF